MIRITGPHDGFYIAARAQQIGSGWMGEARVFANRPSTFDDQSPEAKFAGDSTNAPSDLVAIENAERVARHWITQQRLYEQFDLAKSIYAWHQVLLMITSPKDREFVAQKMEEARNEFVYKGGVAKTGVGPFGDKGPALETSDGKKVPYETGRILAQEYAQRIRTGN